MSRQHPNTTIVTLAMSVLAVACGGAQRLDDQVEQQEAELTLAFSNPFGKKIVVQPADLTDRMVWDNAGNNRAEYWTVREYGAKYQSHAIVGANSSSWAVGVAGNLVLWNNGNVAELQTIDASGNVVATHALQSPGAGYQPTGLALARPPSHGCYRQTEQDYFVTWNSSEEFAIQLVSETGYVRRTTFQAKPFAGLAAMWFGYGSDNYEAVLFRDQSGDAYRYRAQMSSTMSPPRYLLQNLQIIAAPSGYQAQSITAKKKPSRSLMGGTSYNDFILFGRWSGDEAKLLVFDAYGNPVRSILGGNLVWSFSNSGLHATAYAYVPPVCN